MTRWRIALHALDRTGPPVLARGWLRWLTTERPDDEVEVVAFRGGPLLDDLLRLAPVHVLLDPSEPWDHAQPDTERVAEVRRRAGRLAPADVTLLVSVAAGQALPYTSDGGETVAWVVEQGEDLHWLAPPLQLADRVDRWLAGSDGTRADLAGRGIEVAAVAPEFVETPEVGADVAARCRGAAGVADDGLLVVGAGIATRRKAPDLFVEVALAHGRDRTRPPATFVWLGGERDPLFDRLRAEVDRLGLRGVRFAGDVVDVTPWLAAADVLLHPARLDAFPLVCVTAAALGTPVVGFSGAGGLEEMFGSAFVGAPYPDVAALADQLRSLADPGARRRAGEGQREAVTPAFLAPQAAPRLHDAVRGALR